MHKHCITIMIILLPNPKPQQCQYNCITLKSLRIHEHQIKNELRIQNVKCRNNEYLQNNNQIWYPLPYLKGVRMRFRITLRQPLYFSPWQQVSVLFICLCFVACFASCVPLLMSVWRLTQSPVYFPIAPISLSELLELEAPLCACGLFTRSTDSPSEVWLACAGRGEKYEWIHNTPNPPFLPSIPLILPSSFFLSTCSSATSSHTFPLVCACVSESVFV